MRLSLLLALALSLAASPSLAKKKKKARSPTRAPTLGCSPDTLVSSKALGKVCGVDSSVLPESVVVYKGIPFAQAPVKTLRFQAPRPYPMPFKSMFRATRGGSPCPQWDPFGSQPMLVGSENCLTLNVFKPKNASSSELLPVMVWIYGGEFLIGYSTQGMYDGSRFAAQQNVIVVSMNYRLGVLGFLANPAKGIKGNMGILDQRLAMAWVQSHIAVFGGDPSKVTVFGESAGAMSTGLHLFSAPQSSPLFRAAIMESNVWGLMYPTNMLSRYDTFKASLCNVTDRVASKCTFSLQQLQNAPLATIMDADALFQSSWAKTGMKTEGLMGVLSWMPWLDGVVVRGQPSLGYVPGMPHKPFVFGFNRNESVLFVSALSPRFQGMKVPLQDYAATAVLGMLYGSKNAQKIQLKGIYNPALAPPTPTYNRNRAVQSLNNVAQDALFGCSAIIAARIAANQSSSSGVPVYGYFFSEQPSAGFVLSGANISVCTSPSLGNVCHTSEIPFVFDNLDYAFRGVNPPPTSDRLLARTMNRLWGKFARDLAFANQAEWPLFTKSGPVSLKTFGDGSKPGVGALNCAAVWERMPPFGPVE